MFIQWVHFQYPREAKRLFAVPNGEFRTLASARRLKAEGAMAGVSDLLFLRPNDRYHGLCLEFKKSGETWSAVRPSQREFLQASEEEGYAAAVAFGFDHGKHLFTRYLAGEPVTLLDCQHYAKDQKKHV